MSELTAPDSQPSVAIETHGCKLNQADSGLLASDMLAAGFRLVPASEPADVYIVNTCTVTHVADRKARHSLRAARRRNPDATIVATGCYAERSPDVLAGLSEVDLVARRAVRARIASIIVESRGKSTADRAIRAPVVGPAATLSRARALVKIQEGCDQVCAYCIVPKVRGRERSIPPPEIIGRINELVSSGVNEVVLTGTQLGSYGFDLTGIDLAGLLRRILSESDVQRLRVSSIQPQEIGLGLLDLWADARLCPHFHLALQSGNDEVLRRMRRRYTARQFVETVDKIRAAVPGVSITTDVIVGFPGESEDDFRETYALCDRVGFSAMHLFPYSARPGTSATHFGGRVDPEAKGRRMAELLALSRRHAAAFRARFLGSTRTVLWEGRRSSAGDDRWSGLTDNYIRVVGGSSTPLTNLITRARLMEQEEDLVLVQVL